MAKTKFFRIAVEGATVDGRVIQREWLEQMATNYDPATYAARINCEHIAGYSPDRPFNAYGTVLSLKTEQVDLTIAGEKKTLLGLYAEIDANDQLVAINKADQKLFTSCEIHPDFAGAGSAYLVGLAVTDQPASLGTEPLKFAAMTRANHFTDAHETEIELVADPVDGKTLGESIAAGIASFFKKEKPDAVTPPAPPAPPANDNGFDVAAFSKVMGDQIAAAIKPANDAVAALQGDFASLKSQLEQTESQPFRRAPATGGKGVIETDC